MGWDSLAPKVFRRENGRSVDLPTQIQERLDALGVIPSDVEERFIRGSGPGGQKINKTSSTVCVKHRPTGVEVRCQKERSQAANRETAWVELCVKLEERLRAAEQQRQQAVAKTRRTNRKRSARQKAISVAGKRHRAEIKAGRGAKPASGEQ
ncbi:MAG: peptide chain release factor-like protein [Opitutaceae bacterium]